MTNGRGAWTSVGGTLTLKNGKVVPGPYYLATDGDMMIGSKVAVELKAGKTPDVNEYGVYMGVKELQRKLNDAMAAKLVVDGEFGPKTDAVIRAYQTKNKLEVDGLIGPKTAEKLFLASVKLIAADRKSDWKTIFGLLHQESSFDPGAVGYYDPNDFGLAQINGPASGLTAEARFDGDFAIKYACDRLNNAIIIFDGNVEDAIASYNLGEGGCRTWIKAGRPAEWTPSGSKTKRDVKGYIDNILNYYKTL